MAVASSGDLARAVEGTISTLTKLFDDIGIPESEKRKREVNIYTILNECLSQQLKCANSEKEELIEECRKIIKSIKTIERSIHDNDISDENDLRITPPLIECLRELKEKERRAIKSHAERFEAVKDLANALRQYAGALEPSFLKIELPPVKHTDAVGFNLSPPYFDALDREFTRVYTEYQRRINSVQQTATDIVQLWAELGTHALQTDRKILQNHRESPEVLGLREEDMRQLEDKKRKLLKEKAVRERKTGELKEKITQLWDKLNEDEDYRAEFLATHRCIDQRTIQELEHEFNRMARLKAENIHVFVQEARQTLQKLWDELYFSEDEMLAFTHAFSEEYTDSLLSTHETEINRLQGLIADRAPILSMIEKHLGLLNDRQQLAVSASDTSRLMSRGGTGERRDPGKLLREEKLRKRIAKELPRVEADLRVMLEQYEEDHGAPFTMRGENYLDTLAPPAVSTVGTLSRSSSKISSATIKAAAAATPAKPTTTVTRARSQSVKNATIGRSGTIGRSAGPPPPRPNSGGSGSTSGASGSARPSSRGARPKTPTIMAPPPRPATTHSRPKTPTIGRKGSNYASGSKTPTRIGRPPLSNLTQESNSPEDRPESTIVRGMGSIRIGGSGRSAPKMGSLSSKSSGYRSESEPTEDYTPRRIYHNRAYLENSYSAVKEREAREAREEQERLREEQERIQERIQRSSYSVASPSISIVSDTPAQAIPRQFSGNSNSSSNAGSGGSSSENWETFESDDDAEYYQQPPYRGSHHGIQKQYGASYGTRTPVAIVSDEHDWPTDEDY